MLSVTMAGLNAAQKEMNVTSNNLANASTVGFKRSYANFGDVFSSDPAANPKTTVGAGVLTSSISRDMSAGALKTTGRATDMAMDGRGFFITSNPDSTDGAYTYSRAGNFGLDSDGYVVDPGGYAVMAYPTSSGADYTSTDTTYPTASYSSLTALQIPATYSSGDVIPDAENLNKTALTSDVVLQGISISSKGEVQATYSDNNTYTMGFVAVANFANEGGLKPIGGNRYSSTGISGDPVTTVAGSPDAGNIMSGALEQANVDITNELMDMIRAQQVYNGNARMLQTTVETVSRITDKL
jgi:flagellar hook protein FlgE